MKGKLATAGTLENSLLYREFLAEREEILRLKWIESEKAGYDITFEKALLIWVRNHRYDWRKARRTPVTRTKNVTVAD